MAFATASRLGCAGESANSNSCDTSEGDASPLLTHVTKVFSHTYRRSLVPLGPPRCAKGASANFSAYVFPSSCLATSWRPDRSLSNCFSNDHSRDSGGSSAQKVQWNLYSVDMPFLLCPTIRI